ncbi:flagellar export chaperone FliS [Piscinibacter koreensis]|uniref:Flagellar secretion chaperone FliS n=1 Tax=Piscinibacter koreensis TaxID=2742824 RepID=A0A7Y6TWD9_9BURK|nr:flagellar export chaperone FliS [Schlegelella koreensis]NUZ05943.1 flagellar export chaperone FliS [Schlegelella koreensis]
MFSSANHLGSRRPFASSYRDVNASTAIEGASPHKLVNLLFQSASSEIAAARGAIARSHVAEKGRAISHAVRIIEEGLMAPLDMKAGGALAINLRDLYQYLVHRLTMANLNSDDAALVECARLLDVLRDGWDAIGSQVEAPAVAA